MGSGSLSFPTGVTFRADATELYVGSFGNSRILGYDAVTVPPTWFVWYCPDVPAPL